MYRWERINVKDDYGNTFIITGPPEYMEWLENCIYLYKFKQCACSWLHFFHNYPAIHNTTTLQHAIEGELNVFSVSDEEFLRQQIQIQSDQRIAFNLIQSNKENLALNNMESNSHAHSQLHTNTLEEDTEISNFSHNFIEDHENEEIQTWTDAATKLLINLYNEYNKQVGKTVRSKTKKKLWELIKTTMMEEAYNFTYLQIENKWKTLERAYKRKTENNNKTGRGRATCSYERELQECMVEKSSVSPEYLLNSDDYGRTKNDIIEAAGVNTASSISTSNTELTISTPACMMTVKENVITQPSIIKRNSIAKELRDFRLCKEEYHTEMIELANKKLSAYEERRIEISRKNNLIEQLISTLQNK